MARIVDGLDIDVHAFGITADFRTQLFPGSKRLIELADRVQVLQVEALCWCGRKATHNARIIGGVMVVEGEQVVVATPPRPRPASSSTRSVSAALHAADELQSARAAARDADIPPFDLDICPVPPTA